MKKKNNVIFAIGIILLCISIVLSIIATNDKNIIGGADFYTLLFVFFYDNSGLYSAMAFLGIGAIITAVIMSIISKRKQ